MNNNRLLVTIEHEHTRRLPVSLSPPLVFNPLFTPFRSFFDTQTAFSLWFTNALRFHFTPLALSSSSHLLRRNIDIWVEGHTTHSTRPRSASVPLSAEPLKLNRWQCLCMQKLRTHRVCSTWFTISSGSRFVDVCWLRQICGEQYWLWCSVK